MSCSRLVEPSHNGIGGELILYKMANRANNDVRDRLLCIEIKRRKSWDDEGVAATVGTLLSLMVFLTGLGMFTNQYVPIWMEDNESTHMDTVISQFSMLKAGIDMQILTSSSTGDVSSAPLYTPIRLNADGIPVFASPTAGTMSLATESINGYPSFVLMYNYTVGSGASAQYFELNGTNGGKAGGSLEFEGHNRYYVQQTLSYENGAIVLNQTNGEVVISGIAIRVVSFAGDILVKFTQVSLTGINKSQGGFGTKSVTSVLEYANYAKYYNTSGTPLTMVIVSKYGNAWEKYFQDLRDTNDAGISSANWTITKSSFTSDSETYYSIIVTINGINSLEYTKATVSMTMGEIGV